MNKVFIVVNDIITIQNFRLELLYEIKRRGYEVSIICPNTSDYMDQNDFRNFISENNLNLICVPLSRLGINPFSMLNYLCKLYKIFKNHQPAHVLLYTSKAVIFGSCAGYFAGIKNITSTITGLGFVFASDSYKANLLSNLLKPMYKLSLKLNNNIFFQNRDDKNFFLVNKLANSKKSHLIGGSGVNLNRFYPTQKSNDTFTFLMIARVIPEKGVFDYVEASKIFHLTNPNCKVQLLGPLEKKGALISKTMIQNWTEKKYIQYISPKTDVRPYLKEADVFVLPSYREGTPKAALEAMAMAKPLIVTDVPGCREVVEDYVNGIKVPLKNPTALCEAMKKLYSNNEFLQSAGQASLQKAQKEYDVIKINTFFLDQINII